MVKPNYRRACTFGDAKRTTSFEKWSDSYQVILLLLVIIFNFLVRLVNKIYEGTSNKTPQALKIRCPLKFNTMSAPFKQVFDFVNYRPSLFIQLI